MPKEEKKLNIRQDVSVDNDAGAFSVMARSVAEQIIAKEECKRCPDRAGFHGTYSLQRLEPGQ